MPEKLPVYLDSHATTPVDRRVLEEMLPYFTETYGNASSVDHEAGAVAQQAVERARRQVANAINAKSLEIVFTSGATEANNLAILGVAEGHTEKGRHIITCATEHPAVLDPCRFLERRGWRVTVLPVDRYGVVDLGALRRSISAETVLISVMAANNEIGTIAPLHEIGRLARERGVIFHTDATQALGKIPIDVESLGIDLLSISAHKVYGPKGIGALYMRRRSPRVRLAPLLHGGGHERGLRSGTLNVPGIVGLGKAVEVAVSEMHYDQKRLALLRDQLYAHLSSALGDVTLNGHPTERLPNNLNVSIGKVDSKALLHAVKQYICISAGSACTTMRVEPSHVLRAIGMNEAQVYQSVRFGLGRMTTADDIQFAGNRVVEASLAIRKLAH